MYNDVLQAMKDAGKSGSFSYATNNFNAGAQPDGVGSDQIGELRQKGEEMRNAAGAIREGALAKLQNTKPIFPTSLSKVWSYNVTLPIMGATVIDFTPYQSHINGLRLLMLAVILVMGWMAGTRIVGWAFAN